MGEIASTLRRASSAHRPLNPSKNPICFTILAVTHAKSCGWHSRHTLTPTKQAASAQDHIGGEGGTYSLPPLHSRCGSRYVNPTNPCQAVEVEVSPRSNPPSSTRFA